MIQSPCKGCAERHTACHDHCEKYLAYRKALDAYNHNRQFDQSVLGSVNARIKDLNIKAKNKRK